MSRLHVSEKPPDLPWRIWWATFAGEIERLRWALEDLYWAVLP